MPNTSPVHGEVRVANSSMQVVPACHQAALAVLDASTLLELFPDSIIVRDRHDAIIVWNHGAELTYGWTADEALRKNARALRQPPDLDESAAVDAMLGMHGRWQGEIVHKRCDGTRIVVESRQVVSGRQ